MCGGGITGIAASDFDGDGYGDMALTSGGAGVYIGLNDRATGGTPTWTTIQVSATQTAYQMGAPQALVLGTFHHSRKTPDPQTVTVNHLVGLGASLAIHIPVLVLPLRCILEGLADQSRRGYVIDYLCS